MPGRVFRSGRVQVVQNLRVLPSCLHPRSRLGDALAERLGEALYLPVYDLAAPDAGPLAVIEALLARGAPDSMLVANLMSFMGSQMGPLTVRLRRGTRCACLQFCLQPLAARRLLAAPQHWLLLAAVQAPR